MKTTLKLVALTAMAAALAGCGTTNNYLAEKTKSTEMYRVFKVTTDAPRSAVASAASRGLGRNVNNAREATPIPSSARLPDGPGRFKVEEPLAGTRLGAFTSAVGGLGLKVVSCEGAVWTAQAVRDIAGSDHMQINACLWQHKGGYHLDLYAHFTKKEGGLMQISRDMAQALVGTPEQWAEKTLLDIVRQIRVSTGAQIALVEGYPELSGTPWVDNIDAMGK